MKLNIILILISIMTNVFLIKHSNLNSEELLKLGDVCKDNEMKNRRLCMRGYVCRPEVDKDGIVIDAFKLRCLLPIK